MKLAVAKMAAVEVGRDRSRVVLSPKRQLCGTVTGGGAMPVTFFGFSVPA